MGITQLVTAAVGIFLIVTLNLWLSWTINFYTKGRNCLAQLRYRTQERLVSLTGWGLLAVTILLTAAPITSERLRLWSSLTNNPALTDLRPSTMLKAAAALITLLTFAATILSGFVRDQATDERYLGQNLRTHLYTRTVASSALSSRIFQLLVFWLALAPVLVHYTPGPDYHLALPGIPTANLYVQAVAIASWTAAFVTTACVLSLNIVSVIRLSALQLHWDRLPQEAIEQQRLWEYCAAHKALLRFRSAHDASESSAHLTRQVIGLLKSIREPDEQLTLLELTLNHRDRQSDLTKIQERIIRPLEQHGPLRRLSLFRSRIPATLNSILDGRRKVLVSAVFDTSLPERTREQLLHRLLDDVQIAHRFVQELLRAAPDLKDLMTVHPTHPTKGPSRTEDIGTTARPASQPAQHRRHNKGLTAKKLTGILRTKTALCRANSRLPLLIEEDKDSPFLEAVPFATYYALAERIKQGPCSLTLPQLQQVFNTNLLREYVPCAEPSSLDLHQRTTLAARSSIIEAVFQATVTDRHPEEPLPLDTVRTLMHWDRKWDLDQVTPLDKAFIQYAESALQVTAILTPGRRTELLHYTSNPIITLTALLNMLLYYGRSGRQVEGADLTPFYRWLTAHHPSVDLTQKAERVYKALRRSHVHHIITDPGVAWLLEIVDTPLTFDSFNMLHEHRRKGLDLSYTHLCLWWALSNPSSSNFPPLQEPPENLDHWERELIADSANRAADILSATDAYPLVRTAALLRLAFSHPDPRAIPTRT